MRESYPPLVSPKRIGVLAALIQGFDQVAARPVLILPPLVLDLFLWLGPRVKITSLFSAVQSFFASLVTSAEADQSVLEQFEFMKSVIEEMGQRFNLLVSLSSLPIGIPSLIKTRLPDVSPIGLPQAYQMSEPALVLGFWVVLTLLGLGVGASYHRWIVQEVAPDLKLGVAWVTWLRAIGLALVAYLMVGLVLTGVSLIASLAALLSPLFGMAMILAGFSLLFWLVVYLCFTPHGIVRYQFNIWEAMKESAQTVRWNMVSTLGLLSLILLVSWLTGEVWLLPEEGSWFLLLALVGHAFVTSTLLAGSYAFYQNRREWLLEFKQALAERLVGDDPSEQAG